MGMAEKEESEAPGRAPLAATTDGDAPPEKPISGTTLYLEEHYEALLAEFGELDDEQFKAEVKKRFRSLPKEERQVYKKRAKLQKEQYYDAMEVYLITHPQYVLDEKDQEGIKKYRLKRSAEDAQLSNE